MGKMGSCKKPQTSQPPEGEGFPPWQYEPQSLAPNMDVRTRPNKSSARMT